MFLINSRLGHFSAIPARLQPRRLGQAETLLFPKLRSKFAEFLYHGSLEHLRLFASPTCVGFGTDNQSICIEVFLGSGITVGSFTRRLPSPLRLGVNEDPDLPKPSSYALGLTFPIVSQLSLLRHPIAQTRIDWYRNI